MSTRLVARLVDKPKLYPRRTVARCCAFAVMHMAEMSGKRVLPTSERARRRYAEDADYRRRRLAANRAYFVANRAAINARRRRQLADPVFRIVQRIRRYGMSWEDYKSMSTQQGDACAICRIAPSRALCVDHCHSTGRVRGLLCYNCNGGLGFFEDAPDRLWAAAEYVEAFAGDGQT